MSENGVPVQLEDRYVNLHVAPDFLMQDFTTQHTDRLSPVHRARR